MTLLVLGVNHRSAPLRVLDELAADPQELAMLPVDAVRLPSVSEAMVLATCNRLEVYADVAAFHASSRDLADLLAKAMGTNRDDLLPHLYISYGEAAVRHVFEVAAGLDSLVVGEQQIVGQVRGALAAAQEAGTAAKRLNSVLQAALRAAKRIHTGTDIDRHGASVVSVGLAAAQEALGTDLASARALVVGAGAMASLAVATLHAAGVRDLTVLNRSHGRAASLAAPVGADVAGLAELPDRIGHADLIVTCTGSTDLILHRREVAAARRSAEHPLTLLDLAMPHDTDPALGELPGVTRIALIDLVDRPERAASADDLAQARRILDEELHAYTADEARRRLDPLVVSLRARAGEYVAAEADRVRARMPHLSADDLAEVENALRRAVNGLLHTPTVRVQELANDPQGHRFADALHSLFDLPEAAIEALRRTEDDEPGRPS
jgi:glutamyl-tRNA reductase